MFSAKLFTALPLVLLVVNAVDAITHGKMPTKHSQCSQWRARWQGPSGTSPPAVTARVMTPQMAAKTQKPQSSTGSLMRRNTPPRKIGMDIASGKHSICDHNNGYNTTEVAGVCLWTGERQSPEYTNKKFYPGWLNYEHPENCYRKIWLNPAKSRGEAKYGLVLDGCAFVEEGETISEDDGCATVWVTRLLFEQLGGKKGEHSVTIRSWDFEAHSAPGN
ncbi:hypothetical protein PGT21_036601 [Puccinia graminis f. sp. tritici]|uniref:Secreted protein n=1 Tax=Puccinia graminis f. sp. tritici TaxID=56615 RepID=A0A5B0NU52_PUCGR|nr:hypothetical protein PGT21_036601 [Puccinia graminis f. sp. tritici]KAA1097094.1 hypothetical protein PGTUg99_004771 [Puccinia graminis f. sp. tritici]